MTPMPVTVTFNSREVILPLFRVGVEPYERDGLRLVWDLVKDWQSGDKAWNTTRLAPQPVERQQAS